MIHPEKVVVMELKEPKAIYDKNTRKIPLDTHVLSSEFSGFFSRVSNKIKTKSVTNNNKPGSPMETAISRKSL